jgi:hypothetical protein
VSRVVRSGGARSGVGQGRGCGVGFGVRAEGVGSGRRGGSVKGHSEG